MPPYVSEPFHDFYVLEPICITEWSILVWHLHQYLQTSLTHWKNHFITSHSRAQVYHLSVTDPFCNRHTHDPSLYSFSSYYKILQFVLFNEKVDTCGSWFLNFFGRIIIMLFNLSSWVIVTVFRCSVGICGWWVCPYVSGTKYQIRSIIYLWNSITNSPKAKGHILNFEMCHCLMTLIIVEF